jgi:formylglycine-generating enzyme required for sulfatase activity
MFLVAATSTAAPLSVDAERTLNPGDKFVECDQCPQMIVVKAGSFLMGSPSDQFHQYDEVPQHLVTFTRPFAVGIYSVTFDEWDACVADRGCNGYRPDDSGWGRGRRPVINVSWNDVKAYVAWVSGKTGQPYRLLSEAEREYVTRAGTNATFWWGPSITSLQANFSGRFIFTGDATSQDRQQTLPVDSFAPNPWGLYQVHGNVWEWVEDCGHVLNAGYNGAPSDGSAWTDGVCDGGNVIRGGSWDAFPGDLRASARGTQDPDNRFNNLGFRVARPLGS